MKNILILFCLFCCINISAKAQRTFLTDTCIFEYSESNLTQLLGEDSLCSTFMIQVPHLVPLHKHAHHSENVLIVDGEGIMRLANDTFTVRKGSWVIIPKGTAHSLEVTSEQPIKVMSVQSPRFDGKDRILMHKP